MFDSLFFFQFTAGSRYLSLFLLSFSFILWSDGTAKFTIREVLFCLFVFVFFGGGVFLLFVYFLFWFFFFFFFLLTVTWSVRLADIWWFVCISKPQEILCVSFSRWDSGLCINHLFVWSNLNFWQNSQGSLSQSWLF